MRTIYGYKKGNEQFAVRNHVVVYAMERLCTNIAKQITNSVNDSILLFNPYGRGEVGKNKKFSKDTIKNILTHPNVFGVIVVCYEQQDCLEYQDFIKNSNIPVQVLAVNQLGDRLDTLKHGMEVTGEFLMAASELKKIDFPARQLKVGIIVDNKCEVQDIQIFSKVINRMSKFGFHLCITKENGKRLLENGGDVKELDIEIIESPDCSIHESATLLASVDCHLMVYLGKNNVPILPIVPLIKVSSDKDDVFQEVLLDSEIDPNELADKLISKIISVSSGEQTFHEIVEIGSGQIWLPNLNPSVYI